MVGRIRYLAGSGPALQLFNSSPGTYTGTDNAYFTSGGAPKLLLAGRTYGAATLPNERGSLVQDPAFVDGAAATPDLHLASASALRDRGTASPSTGALQSGCAASIDAYCGTAPEPGAFELDATPWEIGAATHAHPTLSEVVGEAAMAVDGRSINF